MLQQSYIVTPSVPPSRAGEWAAEAKRRRKDGTRFRGSDSDAGTAPPDSERSCETGLRRHPATGSDTTAQRGGPSREYLRRATQNERVAHRDVGLADWHKRESKTETLSVRMSPGGSALAPEILLVADFACRIDAVGRPFAFSLKHVVSFRQGDRRNGNRDAGPSQGGTSEAVKLVMGGRPQAGNRSVSTASLAKGSNGNG